jgi:putative ABC transport system ATP-binding protein
MYAGIKRRERTKRAKELLKTVGMEERSDHNPNELSGGQKQRVAIARAMANDPSIILADEPTGALDTKTGRIVMDIFHELHRSGKTIILITHSPELAKETERIITISDGNIISDTAGGAVNGAD